MFALDGPRGTSVSEVVEDTPHVTTESACATIATVSICIHVLLITSLLQPTSRRTAAASGTRRRPSSETRRSTASRHRRPGRSGATARTRAATRRCAASTETSRTARCHPTPTSLITTTNSAGDYHLCSYSWKNIIIWKVWRVRCWYFWAKSSSIIKMIN